MKVKVKKISKYAQVPTRAHEGDAGWDLTAATETYASEEASGLYIEYGTGLCFEIPKGYVGLVFPRSSISRTRHSLRNSVAVIDAGYRGKVKLRFSSDPHISCSLRHNFRRSWVKVYSMGHWNMPHMLYPTNNINITLA